VLYFFLYNNYSSAELSFKLTLHLCIMLKANQFIIPIPVYKFVSNIVINIKILPLTVYFTLQPQTLATGLSLQILVSSVHISFWQLGNIESVTSQLL